MRRILRLLVAAVLVVLLVGVMGCKGKKKTIPETTTTSPKATLSTAPQTGTQAGTIVFSRGRNIWRMKPDGGDLVQLTSSGLDYEPDISPDGTSVVFCRYARGFEVTESQWGVPSSLYTINIDGTNERQVEGSEYPDRHCIEPAFDPDGEGICLGFVDRLENGDRIGIAVISSSDVVQGEPRIVVSELTDTGGSYTSPEYSKKGDSIFFLFGGGGGPPGISIEKISTDGTGRTEVAPFEPGDYNAGIPVRGYFAFDISPDGSKIASVLASGSDLVCTLRTMNIDGSGRVDHDLGELTANRTLVTNISWSPDGTRLALAGLPADRSNILYEPDLYECQASGAGVALVAQAVNNPSWGVAP